MIIRSKNFVLKLEEILKDRLPTERYNEHEIFVLNIIRKWNSSAQLFEHQTSGSTGRPKNIQISRDRLKISAEATRKSIDPENRLKSSLLCLDPSHIGGAMVVYRSLIYDHDLTIVSPSSRPLEDLPSQRFDLVSMVPIQYSNLSEDEKNRFTVILVGGAPTESTDVPAKARVYSTFGMTETVSHIALRPLNSDIYTTTGDTIVTEKDQQLKVKGSITSNKWLLTNDIVEVHSETSFKWIGRKDFIINSGGVKINPEEIEKRLSPQMKTAFIIGSLPDQKLGRKVVLISGGEEQPISFDSLPSYHRPKEVHFNQKIYTTANGKLDRKATQLNFEKNI